MISKKQVNGELPAGTRVAGEGTSKDSPQTLCSQIAAQPFFKGLSPCHLRIMAASAMRVQFHATELIFRTGDPANRLYLILQGRVLLEAVDRNGAVHHLQDVGPQDVFGWSWLYPPYCWHFDAVALEKTDALSFHGPQLRVECEKDAEFGYELLKRISQILIERVEATRHKWVNGDWLC